MSSILSFSIREINSHQWLASIENKLLFYIILVFYTFFVKKYFITFSWKSMVSYLFNEDLLFFLNSYSNNDMKSLNYKFKWSVLSRKSGLIIDGILA